MFHKELIERLTRNVEVLEGRIKVLEKHEQELGRAVYFRYYDYRYVRLQEMSASTAVEKILDHLHLTFECEPAKEQECHLVSTLPVRKPKKKAKKKK